MYQRPEAVRVVVEPTTQSGRANRRSVGYEQNERCEEWGADMAKERVDVLSYHPRLCRLASTSSTSDNRLV